MLYCANASSLRVRDAMTCGDLGQMCTPNERRRPLPGVVWAADNGCFSTRYVGDGRWMAWLADLSADAGRCLFATAPDVVGDAQATLARSRPWLPGIRRLGYRAALVAQDGLEHLDCPWDEFDVLFVGGTTVWKLAAASRDLIAEAKRLGKWVHMGRVNSRRRWSYAEHIGCDSVDGTFGVAWETPANQKGRTVTATRTISLAKDPSVTEIVNLTPHPIRLYDLDTPDRIDGIDSAPLRMVYPAAEKPARLATIDLGTQSMTPPVELVEYGHVDDLPAPSEGVRYIVPLIVHLMLAPRRGDLLSPYLEVRNREGTVIGCRMLQQVV